MWRGGIVWVLFALCWAGGGEYSVGFVAVFVMTTCGFHLCPANPAAYETN